MAAVVIRNPLYPKFVLSEAGVYTTDTIVIGNPEACIFLRTSLHTLYGTILVTADGCRVLGEQIIPYHPDDVEAFIAQ